MSTPRRHGLSSNAPSRRQGTIVSLQQTAGNAAVSRLLREGGERFYESAPSAVQRQEDGEASSEEPEEDAEVAMGAPPIITEDVEFSATDEGAGEAAAVQGSFGHVVQRQTQPPMGQPSFRPPAGCPVVTFADFPRSNPAGPYLANTAFSWSLRKRRFTVAFDRGNSWVRPRAVANQQLERHEQYHLRLACAIATIANDMLARGDNERTVTAQLRNTLTIQTQQYDAGTKNGTLAQQQAAFEQAIDAGQVQMAGP